MTAVRVDGMLDLGRRGHPPSLGAVTMLAWLLAHPPGCRDLLRQRRPRPHSASAGWGLRGLCSAVAASGADKAPPTETLNL